MQYPIRLKIKKFLKKHNFSQLLTSLILLFAFRPYDSVVLKGTWQIILTTVFSLSIYSCSESRNIRTLAAFFALPALVSQWILLAISSDVLTIFSLSFTTIFIFFTTSLIIKHVVISARVRLESLRGVICAYFMLGFGFAFIYTLLEHLMPGTFHFSFFNFKDTSHSRHLSEMLYFSFVTLLGIGYGDIVAVGGISQTMATLEGMMGQLYVAILVARFVGVYSFYQHKLHLSSKSSHK